MGGLLPLFSLLVAKISPSLKYIGEKYSFLNEALKSNENTLFTGKKKKKQGGVHII